MKQLLYQKLELKLVQVLCTCKAKKEKSEMEREYQKPEVEVVSLVTEVVTSTEKPGITGNISNPFG